MKLENALENAIGKLVVMTDGCENNVEVINPKLFNLPESYTKKEEMKLNGISVISLEFEEKPYSALITVTKENSFVIKYTDTNALFKNFVLYSIFNTILNNYALETTEVQYLPEENSTADVMESIINNFGYEETHKSKIENMYEDLKYRAPYEEKAENIREAIDTSTTVSQALSSAKIAAERQISQY